MLFVVVMSDLLAAHVKIDVEKLKTELDLHKKYIVCEQLGRCVRACACVRACVRRVYALMRRHHHHHHHHDVSADTEHALGVALILTTVTRSDNEIHFCL